MYNAIIMPAENLVSVCRLILKKILRSGWYLLQTVNRFSRLLEQKKLNSIRHYFLAIILATKRLINFLPNHCNKNVDVFIVLVIDVFLGYNGTMET